MRAVGEEAGREGSANSSLVRKVVEEGVFLEGARAFIPSPHAFRMQVSSSEDPVPQQALEGPHPGTRACSLLVCTLPAHFLCSNGSGHPPF